MVTSDPEIESGNFPYDQLANSRCNIDVRQQPSLP
jgi:hypothetical protein